MEKTLIIVKPDAVASLCAGDIVSRIEKKLKLVDIKMCKATKEQIEAHYIEHKDKDFYKDLCHFMCSGKIVIAVFKGENAVNTVRNMLGKIEEKGTIRGDYGTTTRFNACHASDSIESAKYEISVWF